MSSWVKVSRKLLTSAIASKPEYLAVWMHLILSASYKSGEILVGHQIVKLEPGQLVFGRLKFSQQIGVSEQVLRSALKALENLQQITIKSQSKYSIISITNWSKYQDLQPANNQQLTSNQPAVNHNKEIQELQELDQKLLEPACADSHPPKKPRAKKSAEGLIGIDQLISEGCDPDHARDWLQVRKGKRAPLTPTSWKGMHREAAKAGIGIGQAVQIAAERNWQAFNAEFNWRGQHGKSTNGQGNGAGGLSLIEKVYAGQAEQERRRALGRQQDEPAPGSPEWEAEFSRIREVDGSIVGVDD